MPSPQRPRRQRLLLATSCVLAVSSGGPAPAGEAEPAPRDMFAFSDESAGRERDANAGALRRRAAAEDRLAALIVSATRAPTASEPSAMLVEPVVNGRAIAEPIFVVEREKDVLLPVAFLSREGFRPARAEEIFRGRAYAPVSQYPAMTLGFDDHRGRVLIECGAECFEPNDISLGAPPAVSMTPVAPGVFLNYDLFAQAGEPETALGAYAEIGVFAPFGTGLAALSCADRASAPACVRLETSWTIDDPANARRLRLGDAITDAAAWGAPFRFGGVRFGTDFSLRPGFVAFPTPSFAGEAALPGVMELFINDARRFEAGLPAGPFSITDLPVVAGAGSARVVVTDVLGRETVLSLDYYAAPQLLKKGLSEYSLEAGFAREAFALRSNDYGEGFIAGGYARGVSDWATLGGRAEVGEKRQSAGATVAFVDTRLGVFETSVAMSHADGSVGWLIAGGHERRAGAFGVGGTAAYASAPFQRLGERRPAPRIEARSFVSYQRPEFGAASLSWTHRDAREGRDFSALAFRYSRRLGKGSIHISALRQLEPDRRFAASVSFSFSVGGKVSAGVGGDYDGARFGGQARVRRAPGPAGGFGYHGRINVDGVERYEAGAEYRSAFGDLSAAFSKTGD